MAEQIDHALGFVVAAGLVVPSDPSAAIDLGTGGGLPGLVLLDCWPSSFVVLLDSNERRTEFLAEEIAGWNRPGPAQVVRARAEEEGHSPTLREHFDVVVARSFGKPAVVAECGSAFVAVGGVLIVSEPPMDGDRWPVEGLTRLGLMDAGPLRIDDRFSYRILIKATELDDRFPRRVGMPAKRPLF